MKRIALFPGSFDPFTKGHKNIVERTLQSVADTVIIAIGNNCEKKCMQTVEERVESIQRVFKGNEKVRVVAYEGLTIDFAKSVNADFIVRGVRSIKDFEYEREIADVNRKLSGIETILLYTEPEYASISSSIVRELKSYGKDVSQFLP
jgi:pantetheine-phosphate adenylyltransferase